MLAAWNIRCGCSAGLTSVTKGLAQIGVGLVVVMETKAAGIKNSHIEGGEPKQGGDCPVVEREPSMV